MREGQEKQVIFSQYIAVSAGLENFEREKINFEKQKFEVEHSLRLRETALKEAEFKMLEQKHVPEEAEKKISCFDGQEIW